MPPGHADRPGPPGLASDAALRGPLADKVRAYPGTLTYLDLIRRNKRQSALLVLGMLLLIALLGAVLAAALAISGAGPDALVPSALLGILAALVVGGLTTLWSWYGGAGAILRMSGARPIAPADDPELFNVVDEVRLAAGLPMPAVYLIDESALNAFATGRDPAHAAVAITSGLRARLTRDELQGVMAHEMAHVRHLDIRFAMLMATLAGLIVFASDAFWRILRHAPRAGRRKEGGAIVIVLLVAAVLLAILAPIVARLIQMSYSRQREFLADAGAVELTRNPLGLASALEKLAADADPLVNAANRGTAHLFIVNPLRRMREAHQRLNTMFSSHPPVQDRIARLLALTR